MTCPLCNGPAARAFTTTDRNRAVGPERFEYVRCTQCATIFLVDVPADLAPWYPADYFVFPSVPELDAMAASEAYKLDALRPFVSGGRLVEIGPGFGAFARRAAVAGYDVTGIDMDAQCVAHLQLAVGVRAIESDQPQRALSALEEPSDAIVAWHCIEHLRDPWAVLAAAAGNLRPGGVLAAALPNPDAFQLRVLGARWPHVDAPRHLFLIPARTLAARAREEGLELVALTSDDGGARHWNAFGWGRGVLPPNPGKLLSHGSIHLGRAMALAAAPVERRELRGSAYTIVLRKPE